jgi:hypothetical protein
MTPTTPALSQSMRHPSMISRIMGAHGFRSQKKLQL